MKSSTPTDVVEEPASTGTMSPVRTALFREEASSSLEIASPSRYFVARSSSVSATASTSCSRKSSGSEGDVAL